MSLQVYKLVGFWYIAAYFLAHILDVISPGFIFSEAYIAPLGVIGVIGLILYAWKGSKEGEKTRSKKDGWFTYIFLLAISGFIVYKVYTHADLGLGFVFVNFLLISAISGGIAIYERRNFGGRESNKTSTPHVGHK